MKTITLKLTKPEYNTIGYYDIVVEGNTKGFKSVPTHIRGESEQRVSEKEKQLKNGIFEIEILDVDKFRKFLNDEIADAGGKLYKIKRGDHKNLKSILSKLDRVASISEILTNIYDRTSDKAVVQNDEPKSYVGIATNEVTYDMLPKECFIVSIMDHKALDKGELVEIIRVRVGENGFYKGYDGVDSWKALNKLNKDVYGVTDLNVVKVMANQSMHGNYQSEIKYHNEKVNKS